MKVKQLIELLEGFDPETTVVVAYPTRTGWSERNDTEKIHVGELNRHDGIHPLISVNGAHLLEE